MKKLIYVIKPTGTTMMLLKKYTGKFQAKHSKRIMLVENGYFMAWIDEIT